MAPSYYVRGSAELSKTSLQDLIAGEDAWVTVARFDGLEKTTNAATDCAATSDYVEKATGLAARTTAPKTSAILREAVIIFLASERAANGSLPLRAFAV